MTARFRQAVSLLLVGFAGFCFWNAFPGSPSSRPHDGVLASAHASWHTSDTAANRPRLETRPIQDIRVGHRVLAHNAEVSHHQRAGWAMEPDWSTWVLLQLQMQKPDEGVLHIDMIRPAAWLEAQVGASRAQASLAGTPSASQADLIGHTIELDLPELGATGPAVIHAIGSCPEIESGNGRVVTATFRHESSSPVLDVTFADEGQWQRQQRATNHAESAAIPSISLRASEQSPLKHVGVTDNHLFWSADRQVFVPIGKMALGERVQTYHGETKRIAAKLPRPGPQTVFNLEVYGEHVYHVTPAGLLVHNACGSAPNRVQKLGGAHDSLVQYRIRPDLTPQEGSRQAGIDRAWRLEQDLVRRTGKGTHAWTPKQAQELLDTGQVRGFTGHHINNVAEFPEWAGDPRNIRFLSTKPRGGEHLHSLQGHRGNYRNPTTGRMIDREAMLKQLGQL